MQATVCSFDPETRAGTVLLDDGVELAYDEAAFRHGGVRHLRIGQRVQIEVEGSDDAQRVTALAIYTLPPPGVFS